MIREREHYKDETTVEYTEHVLGNRGVGNFIFIKVIYGFCVCRLRAKLVVLAI